MAVQEEVFPKLNLTSHQRSIIAKKIVRLLSGPGIGKIRTLRVGRRIPESVLEVAIESCLSSSLSFVDTLSEYVAACDLLAPKSALPNGDAIFSEEQTEVCKRLLTAVRHFQLSDVLSPEERAYVIGVYLRSAKHWSAQSHYAERRRKANAALANKVLRQQVFDRHGEACLKCGDTNDLAIDHIVPVALGGTDDLDNLQVLCRSCNSSKGSNLEVQETMPNLGTIAGSCDTCGDTTLQVTRVDDNGDPTEGFCIPCNQPEGGRGAVACHRGRTGISSGKA